VVHGVSFWRFCRELAAEGDAAPNTGSFQACTGQVVGPAAGRASSTRRRHWRPAPSAALPGPDGAL